MGRGVVYTPFVQLGFASASRRYCQPGKNQPHIIHQRIFYMDVGCIKLSVVACIKDTSLFDINDDWWCNWKAWLRVNFMISQRYPLNNVVSGCWVPKVSFFGQVIILLRHAWNVWMKFIWASLKINDAIRTIDWSHSLQQQFYQVSWDVHPVRAVSAHEASLVSSLVHLFTRWLANLNVWGSDPRHELSDDV